jgi:hypothetical protein
VVLIYWLSWRLVYQCFLCNDTYVSFVYHFKIGTSIVAVNAYTAVKDGYLAYFWRILLDSFKDPDFWIIFCIAAILQDLEQIRMVMDFFVLVKKWIMTFFLMLVHLAFELSRLQNRNRPGSLQYILANILVTVTYATTRAARRSW